MWMERIFDRGAFLANNVTDYRRYPGLDTLIKDGDMTRNFGHGVSNEHE